MAFIVQEDRENIDNNWIIDCFQNGKHPATGQLVTDVPGLCDGTTGGGWSGTFRFIVATVLGLPAATATKTLSGLQIPSTTSAYISFEWSLSDQWKLTLEDRYVDETFDLTKPNASSCTTFALNIGGGIIAEVPLLDADGNPDLLLKCTDDYFDRSTGPILWDDLPDDLKAFYEPHNLGASDITCTKASGVTMPGFPLNGYGDPIDADDVGTISDPELHPGGTDAGGCPWGDDLGYAGLQLSHPEGHHGMDPDG